MRSLRLLVLLTLLCGRDGVLAAGVAPEEAPRSRFSAEELRSELLKSQERIKSLRVAYRSEYYTDPNAPRGTYLYRVVGAKSPCYFYHLNSHPCVSYAWHEDPMLRIARIQERAGRTIAPFTNSYFVTALTPESPLPGSLPREFFLQATGLWPMVQRQAPRWGEAEIPVALRDVAMSDDYSEVRPFQERVSDRWCHVLAWPAHDYLWLDVERGCALLARESFLPSSGAKVHRYELSQQRECAPDVWLPTRLRSIQFDYPAPTEEKRRRKVVDCWTTVEDVRVNDVPDSLFEFQPPPGALLLYDRHFPEREYPVQATAGGWELLDDLADWIRRRVSREDEPVSWTSYGWCVGFVAFPIVFFLEIGRRLRRRRP